MKPAREWVCPFDDVPADQLHHLTGKDHTGVYLDHDLKVPLVIDQHVAEHQIWDRTGVGETLVGHPIWLRLRRAGQFLVRLGDHHGSGTIELPAPFIRELGLLLLRLAAEVLHLVDGDS